MAKGDQENFEIPVWPDLTARWYMRLNRLARRYEVTRAELLDHALTAYERERKAQPMRNAGVSPDAVHKVMGGYAKDYWASLTAEERVAISAKRSAAAKKRWKNRK